MDTCTCRNKDLDAAQLERLAGVFKALGHPVRLRLAMMLLEGERCVCELHQGSERDMSTISSHLSLLKASGVLQSEQRGKNIYYRLSCDCLKTVIPCMANI